MTAGTLTERTAAWLRTNGWRQVSHGPGGYMWGLQNDFGSYRVGVVNNLDEDQTSFNSLVKRLASAHRQEPREIGRKIQFWETDIALLRAANDSLITDTIPLTAGAVMLESGRLMFRSAASAAMRIRPEIGGNYSRIGDEIAGTVRMGHTERGSYIVPIYVPVGSPETADDAQGSLFENDEEVHQANLIPTSERRMTRTFAEAMQAISELVLQSEKLPQATEINELVRRGVTREFVSALAEVLAQPAVSEFDARFEWAPAQGTPIGVTEHVTVPASEQEKLEHTVRQLKKARKQQFNVLTGPIVMIGKDPDSPRIHVAIKTVRKGRPCRVETWLDQAPLEQVTGWMNEGRTVQLEGIVIKEGHALRVRSPQRFAPISVQPSFFDKDPFEK